MDREAEPGFSWAGQKWLYMGQQSATCKHKSTTKQAAAVVIHGSRPTPNSWGYLWSLHLPISAWGESMTHQKCGLGFGKAKILQWSLCVVSLLALENIKVDLTHEILIHCARAYTAVPVMSCTHTLTHKVFQNYSCFLRWDITSPSKSFKLFNYIFFFFFSSTVSCTIGEGLETRTPISHST